MFLNRENTQTASDAGLTVRAVTSCFVSGGGGGDVSSLRSGEGERAPPCWVEGVVKSRRSMSMRCMSDWTNMASVVLTYS